MPQSTGGRCVQIGECVVVTSITTHTLLSEDIVRQSLAQCQWPVAAALSHIQD